MSQRLPWIIAAWLGLWLALAGRGAELRDTFADRQALELPSGNLRGSNVGTTAEPGEPTHGKRPGGRTVWVTCTAPADGLVSLDTAGSSFDTMLAVYSLKPPEPGKAPLELLYRVARADDEGTDTASFLQFPVRRGWSYEIAIDGFNGATGDIRLRWNFEASGAPLPVVAGLPGDQALRVGDTLVLAAQVAFEGEPEFRWYFNGQEIDDAETPTLTIPNFQPRDVGIYRLRIKVGGVRFFSEPLEIQVNSEGQVDALARNKLLEAEGSSLDSDDEPDGDEDPAGHLPGPALSRLAGGTTASTASGTRRSAGLAAGPVGVVRGYNGTQIFRTLFAGRDPDEPLHCGVAGGSSYWFAYVAPTNGVLTLDTDGSDFDTLLAVYTTNGPVTAYTSLTPVACDNNSGTGGLTSRLSANVEAGHTYFVVVDGVNGARGLARLNYLLTPAAPNPQAPRLLRAPAGASVRAGSTVTLEAVVEGDPPLSFGWERDAEPLAGAAGAILVLTNAVPADTGVYRLVVTNGGGRLETPGVEVRVLETPTVVLVAVPAGTEPVLEFPVWRQLDYTLEAADRLDLPVWRNLKSFRAAGTDRFRFTNDPGADTARFFRVRVR